MTKSARLIFPHQLFLDHLDIDKQATIILIEDDLFFKQYKFHKQKLILHRASMQAFLNAVKDKGLKVEYVESSSNQTMHQLQALLKKLNVNEVSFYDLVDDWLEQRVNKVCKKLAIQAHRLNSPGFLTSRGQIEDYFNTGPNRMQSFYEWQRKRLDILVNNDKPVGGKWSYDVANRKKLPKNIDLPPAYPTIDSAQIKAAKKWVESEFVKNPGQSETFAWPADHQQATIWLDKFVEQRLSTFGPYEDAISQTETELFHSTLSPLINIGLLTPQQVIDKALNYSQKHEVPIESLEGFIRQVIGWREYIRATYLLYGRQMRTKNYLNFKRKLEAAWWDGTTGLTPADNVIKNILKTGYAHHIERLMILGNSMVLLRIDPDQAYEWFMSLFIDAYDWVMVPNVYAMSQFAAGELITTKPYISGSNYIIKMSDYKKDDWADAWDALYWKFVDDKREIIEKNYRSRMTVNLYDRLSADKKKHIAQVADYWLK